MTRPRYKVGDHLYQVIASPAERLQDCVIEPSEIILYTYIVRSIRRSNTKPLSYYSSPTKPQMVTAYPSQWVKKTKKGLVFDKHCPRWALERWRFNDKPNNLHRTKSAAYRAELADLRAAQRGLDKWYGPLSKAEFKFLEGRLKSGVTRNTSKSRA